MGHCARPVHFVTQLVAVDPDGAQRLQVLGDRALPTAAASRQANNVGKRGEMSRVLELTENRTKVQNY